MSISKQQVQHAQGSLPDEVKGLVQLDNYTGEENFSLFGYQLTQVLDDIVLIKYVDCSDDGTEILKNGIYVPINATTFTWRIGEVVLAGPDVCRVFLGPRRGFLRVLAFLLVDGLGDLHWFAFGVVLVGFLPQYPVR